MAQATVVAVGGNDGIIRRRVVTVRLGPTWGCRPVPPTPSVGRWGWGERPPMSVWVGASRQGNGGGTTWDHGRMALTANVIDVGS